MASEKYARGGIKWERPRDCIEKRTCKRNVVERRENEDRSLWLQAALVKACIRLLEIFVSILCEILFIKLQLISRISSYVN